MQKTLAGSVLILALAACNAAAPAVPGTQQPSPFPQTLPTASPRPSPSPTPTATVTPAPVATPSADPSAAAVCPTPPPDDCCGIIDGALHGTVVDEEDNPITTAELTLRTASGRLMGNCSEALASLSPKGEFAFNAVPFDVALILEADAPGFEPVKLNTRLPKGPVQRVVVRMRRAAAG